MTREFNGHFNGEPWWENSGKTWKAGKDIAYERGPHILFSLDVPQDWYAGANPLRDTLGNQDILPFPTL